MLALLLQTTLILLAAFVAVSALGRRSAAARHAVLTAALGCVLLLPLLRSSAAHWRVEVQLPPTRVASAIAGDSAPLVAPAIARVAPARRPIDFGMLWCVGAAIASVRLLLGFSRLRRVIATAVAWPRQQPGIPPNVRLLASGRVGAPVTFGIRRHVILLPAKADLWPADRLEAALAHELAHVRRMDCLTQLIAELACARYWFQPLAWFAAFQLRKERERACDDAVLSRGTKSSDYAEHLVGIVRSIQSKGVSVPMAISFHSNDLQCRLDAILKPRADRRAASWGLLAVVAAASICIVAPLAAIHAQGPAASAAIAGAVYDPSHGVIPRATVTATGLDTHNKEAASAGLDGSYSFQGIPAGRYLIQVRAPGFAMFQKELVLQAGQPLRLDPVLDVGAVNETIDVVGQKPSTSVQASGVPHRIRVGGNVQATKLVYRVAPIYPQHAQEAGIQGAVVLQGVIGTDGSLLSLETVSKSADPELVQAARDAVSQWRYQPTLLNGQPVEVVTTITVNFSLQ
jgi:TonB family protein